MPKKIFLKNIQSSKVKINIYLNNEKVENIKDLEREALKQKLISVNFDDYI